MVVGASALEAVGGAAGEGLNGTTCHAPIGRIIYIRGGFTCPGRSRELCEPARLVDKPSFPCKFHDPTIAMVPSHR
jgi:hypothetical protein